MRIWVAETSCRRGRGELSFPAAAFSSLPLPDSRTKCGDISSQHDSNLVLFNPDDAIATILLCSAHLFFVASRLKQQLHHLELLPPR